MVDVKDWTSLIISCLLSRCQAASDINLKTALLSFFEKPYAKMAHHSEYQPVGHCVVHPFY